MELITSSSEGVLPLAGDLANKVLVLAHTRLNRRYQMPRFQLFKATGGFGCQENSLGRAVFGMFVADSEEARYNRADFIGIASEALVFKAMADTTPVKAINLNDRVYLVISKDGNVERGDSPTQAMVRLRRLTRSALSAAYHVHPETVVNEFGYMSYPDGAAPVEVKLRKQGEHWKDVT